MIYNEILFQQYFRLPEMVQQLAPYGKNAKHRTPATQAWVWRRNAMSTVHHQYIFGVSGSFGVKAT